MLSEIKGTLARVDHIKVNPTINNLNKPGRNLNKTLTNNAATSRGNKQYPSKHIHCSRDKFPPSNFVFKVIIIEPIQMIIKTVVKTVPESFFEVRERILNVNVTILQSE